MAKYLGYPLSVPTIDYINNVSTVFPSLTPTAGMRIMTTATAVSGANLVTPNVEWVYTAGSQTSGANGWVPAAGTTLLHAIQASAQTGLTDATYFPISYTATNMSNPFKVWDSTVSTTRFTAPWTGVYQFSGGIGWTTTGAQHWTGWRVDGNGQYTIGCLVQGLTALIVPNRTWTWRLTAGQYVEQMGMCSSGGTWSTSVTQGYSPSVSVLYQGVSVAAS